MGGYILKIVGVVFISIIVDVILPNGKMEKYVKSVMALIILFVIISPIPSVVSTIKNYKFDTNENLIDYDFIKKTNLKKVENVEDMLSKELEGYGIEKVKISFITDLSSNNIVYLFANVDLENIVLKGQATSINVNEKITEIILENIDIKKENILFYG